jgi:DNA-directed RNA polymerase specialized sigma24 family protein
VYEKVGFVDRMKTEKWRVEMPGGIEKTKREALIREIVSALGQWPERERNVFSQAHYEGQSIEAISRSHRLGVEEVRQILRLCERRLHASLRNLPDDEAISLPLANTARPAA